MFNYFELFLQAEAMVEFMLAHNWTYASVLFSEGSYGENGGKQVERAARHRGICIAYSHMLPSDITDDEMIRVISKLRSVRARVVVMFLDKIQGMLFFKHRDILSGPRGEFIFMTSDSFANRDFGPKLNGGINVFYAFVERLDFTNIVNHMTPRNSAHNPWFLDIWKQHYGCSYSNSSGRRCEDYEHLSIPSGAVDKWVATTFDGFYTVVHALDKLIREKCPHYLDSIDKTDIRCNLVQFRWRTSQFK